MYKGMEDMYSKTKFYLPLTWAFKDIRHLSAVEFKLIWIIFMKTEMLPDMNT